MADKILNSGAVDTTDPAQMEGLSENWHDNGDTTYARTVWVGATITATIGSLQIPDGQDVAEGATTDVAVAGDTAGSLSAKLRGLNKALGTIADAAYASGSGTLLAVAKGIFTRLAKGVQTAANSLSVGIASDQIGTAGTAAAAVLSVQGIAGGTTLPVTVAINGGTPTETIVPVLITSTAVLSANAARKGLVLQNVGANPITVKLTGGTAVASAGLVLNPQASATLGGDRATFGNDLVPATAITAITIVGTTNLYVAEF